MSVCLHSEMLLIAQEDFIKYKKKHNFSNLLTKHFVCYVMQYTLVHHLFNEYTFKNHNLTNNNNYHFYQKAFCFTAKLRLFCMSTKNDHFRRTLWLVGFVFALEGFSSDSLASLCVSVVCDPSQV